MLPPPQWAANITTLGWIRVPVHSELPPDTATAVGQATLEARRTFDATAPGLSNAGLAYGDALSPDDRTALLEYLKSL